MPGIAAASGLLPTAYSCRPNRVERRMTLPTISDDDGNQDEDRDPED